MAIKRKSEGNIDAKAAKAKKLKPETPCSEEVIKSRFRAGLFHEQELKDLTVDYQNSVPYQHGVIRGLMNSDLLSKVREEITTQIHYTRKETDIYRIHQSGDLANLDGLDDATKERLPHLMELRDALYSELFRTYLSTVTKAGPLSGKKTDMAINIYTPGDHLLCHDDVIGTRRVSYILYLTPNWKEHWGGALRLYPTRKGKNSKGKEVRVPNPDPDPKRCIPPSWNQLSFFHVQPGYSYHDVDEVYSQAVDGGEGADEDRTRVAISGWFHIPQEGEAGYKKGEEVKLTKESSLQQLQSKDDEFDLPQNYPIAYPGYPDSAPTLVPPGSVYEKAVIAAGGKIPSTTLPPDPNPDILTTEECGFLLKYMNPQFLVPDTLEAANEDFIEQSFLELEGFLNPTFGNLLKDAINAEPETLHWLTNQVKNDSLWSIAQPPHKQRYLYILPTDADPNKQNLMAFGATMDSPIKDLLANLFPSLAFRKWLRITTGLILRSHDIKARRFRRGGDYQLARSHDSAEQRLEMTLCLTTKGRWEPPEEGNAEGYDNGGYEAWLAPEGDDGNPSEADSSDSGQGPADKKESGKANGGKEQNGKGQKADPAVYQSGGDDGVLFSVAACWNKLSLVLRDEGTMRFVKYVSRGSMADRWDVVGDYEVDWEATNEIAGDDDSQVEIQRE